MLAFSTDLGGVGLFDTNCGKSRGVSDQNNGYRSSGSGYSNSSNKRNGGRKFKGKVKLRITLLLKLDCDPPTATQTIVSYETPL